jgi:non-homologous end joining protein Ku
MEAAAMLAAAQLLGGLFSNKAAQEQFQQKALLDIGQKQFESERLAQSEAAAQQRSAFENLMAAYRSSLGGR